MSENPAEVQLSFIPTAEPKTLQLLSYNGSIFPLGDYDELDLGRPPVDVSHSELKNWNRCTGRWMLKYARNLKPRVSKGTLTRGGIFHEALSDLHSRTEPTPVAARTLKWFQDRAMLHYAARVEAGFDDPKNQLRTTILGLCNTYMSEGPKPIIPFEATEVDFKVPVFSLNAYYEPVWFAGFVHGRLDVIMRLGDKLWIIDYKTKERFTTKGIEWDLQASIYDLVGSKLFGKDYGGFRFRYIRTPPSKKSRNFADLPTRVRPQERRAAENNLAHMLLSLAHVRPEHITWNYNDRCGWDCDFKTVCQMRRAGSDPEPLIDKEFVYNTREYYDNEGFEGPEGGESGE